MELDRPHNLRTSSSSTNNNANNNSELFICFASRLPSSTSSMKLAKSILSPGRAARDNPVSLSSSLSRRLRANGSIKGGGQASPMFPTAASAGKKRATFENPEPSSPKVTCIGQVRVKTKKKAANQTARSLSRRRCGGEASFRKTEQTHDFFSINNQTNKNMPQQQQQQPECLTERNQKWVHLPVTICEALRAFGAEFSCLFPCRLPPCFSTSDKEKEEKGNNVATNQEGNESGQSQSSCGAVFARWFVSLQDCEGKEQRQIELVVGGGAEESTRERRISMRSSRRHVFEGIEFNEEKTEMKEEEEEKGRVSICIPPKNALLLMRCRSDPMKMAGLTNRFWDSPKHGELDEYERDEDEESTINRKDVNEESALLEEVFGVVTNEIKAAGEEKDEESEEFVSAGNLEKDADFATEMQENEEGEAKEKKHCDEESIEMREEEALVGDEEAILGPFEANAGQEMAENIGNDEAIETNREEESSTPYSSSPEENHADQVVARILVKEEKAEADDATSHADEEENESEKTEEEEQTTTHLESQQEEPENENKDEEIADQENDLGEGAVVERDENEGGESMKINKKMDQESSKTKVLPDCLLLMMCEPKLSMEVSKETWICSTDFIRWLPERPVKKVNDEPKKRVISTDPAQTAAQDIFKAQKKRQQLMQQPPRSSCSLPAAAAVSMATMIEQKLVNAGGYEPFVLTRCKSVPMRTAAAKLVPEACCWKNRKLEPHRRAEFGVGAAGLGF